MTRTGLRGRWSATWNSLPPTVWLLTVIAFFVAAGYGVIVPVLPLLATSFGVGLFEVGIVISIFAVSRVILTPFVPRMITKFGDRAMISVGLYITATSYALMGLAQSYEWLVVMRFVAGAGSVMFTIAAMNLLVSVAPTDKRGRALGLMSVGFVLGTMTGPAIGGALALVSITTPFFVYAVTVGGAATIALVLVRSVAAPSQVEADVDVTAAPSLAEVFRKKGFQAALVTNFGQGWAVLGVRTSLVPVIVTSILHQDPVWTGVAIAIGVGVQSVVLLPVSRFVDSVGRRPAIIIGCLICAAASMGLAVAPNLWVLTLALVVMGIGTAFTVTGPPAAVADAAGSAVSRPIAAFSLTQDLGQIIGPVVAGLLWDHTNPLMAFGVGAAILVVGALAGLRMSSERVWQEQA